MKTCLVVADKYLFQVCSSFALWPVHTPIFHHYSIHVTCNNDSTFALTAISGITGMHEAHPRLFIPWTPQSRQFTKIVSCTYVACMRLVWLSMVYLTSMADEYITVPGALVISTPTSSSDHYNYIMWRFPFVCSYDEPPSMVSLASG